MTSTSSTTRTNSPLVDADEEKKLREKLTEPEKSKTIFPKTNKTVKFEN
jgi:hypothetical protein